jgi:hypothetical protein
MPHSFGMVNPTLLDCLEEGKSWAKMWQLAGTG